MGPKRKKSRQNSQAPVAQSAAAGPNTQDATDQGQTARDKPTVNTSVPEDAAKDSPNSSTTSPTPGRSSWYGGSWRLKASPLTETARESISVARGVTSEALADTGKQIVDASKRPGQYVTRGMRSSRKSIPLAAEATRVHATSDASDKSRPVVDSGEKLKVLDGSTEGKGVGEGKERRDSIGGRDAGEGKQVVEESPLPPEPPAENANSDDARSVASAPRPQSGSWFGWWSRPDGYDIGKDKAKGSTGGASSTPLPGTPEQRPVPESEPLKSNETDANAQTRKDEGLHPDKSAKTGSTRSWFGLWSSAQNEQAAEKEPTNKEPVPDQAPEIIVSAEPTAGTQETNAATQNDKSKNEERPASSGWAFWSTDKVKDPSQTPGGTQKQIGELAVADTPSQSHPEAAQFNEQRDAQAPKTKPKRTGSLLKPKRGWADDLNTSGESTSNTPAQSPAPSTPVSETPPKNKSEAPKPVQRGKTAVQSRPNVILPSFKDSYPLAPAPSYIERVTQYVSETLRITDGQTSPQHVFRSPIKPKIKKAISLGIHGFFPAPLIQKVLGQPTGTSIRFANYGAASIKQWCQENQPDTKDVEVEKVALEGEGFVADRVSTLWKLMLNWLSHLRQADFVLVCCHSQGVPVSLALIAKLIQLGCLAPGARIGVCAMAGINLGPFLDYKSRLFGGSALELFDFCDSNSSVSRAYADALDLCLRHGVRTTYVGSLDDQLVSLESALHAPVSHPYVNRAVFVDGRLHAPNFLTHLVIFALKLRNRGVSDHGLLRELSAPLAGSLVAGDGHSRVYDDPAVYRLAVDFALESTDVQLPAPLSASAAAEKEKAKEAAFNRRSSLSGYPSSTAAANSMRRGSLHPSHNLPGIGAVIAPYEAPPSASSANPFYLPWAVRGMLEEELVKREMGEEVRALVEEFDGWKPSSKVLKDVRWRLEAVKGKG